MQEFLDPTLKQVFVLNTETGVRRRTGVSSRLPVRSITPLALHQPSPPFPFVPLQEINKPKPQPKPRTKPSKKQFGRGGPMNKEADEYSDEGPESPGSTGSQVFGKVQSGSLPPLMSPTKTQHADDDLEYLRDTMSHRSRLTDEPSEIEEAVGLVDPLQAMTGGEGGYVSRPHTRSDGMLVDPLNTFGDQPDPAGFVSRSRRPNNQRDSYSDREDTVEEAPSLTYMTVTTDNSQQPGRAAVQYSPMADVPELIMPTPNQGKTSQHTPPR